MQVQKACLAMLLYTYREFPKANSEVIETRRCKTRLYLTLASFGAVKKSNTAVVKHRSSHGRWLARLPFRHLPVFLGRRRRRRGWALDPFRTCCACQHKSERVPMSNCAGVLPSVSPDVHIFASSESLLYNAALHLQRVS